MQPIAIQSWCFRHFKTIPALIGQLKSAGVTAVELCGIHADFGDVAGATRVAETIQSAGISIVAIGVEYLSGDPEKDRSRFEFCRASGIRNMSISFQPSAMFDGLNNIATLADEYDITLGIHNHGGYDWLGNPTILEYLFAKSSPRIGLHLDTAWAIDAKQNPVTMAEKFIDRLHGVHIKDFTYNPKREPTDVIIGTGNLDLPALMKLLKTHQFAGPLVIEYEGDETNPGPKLRECVEKLKPLV